MTLAELETIYAAAATVVVVAAHGVMPYLPAPSAKSGALYTGVYNLARIVAGNYSNASPALPAAVAALEADVKAAQAPAAPPIKQ